MDPYIHRKLQLLDRNYPLPFSALYLKHNHSVYTVQIVRLY